MCSLIKLFFLLNGLLFFVNGAYLSTSNWFIKAKKIEKKSESSIDNKYKDVAYTPLSLKSPSNESLKSLNSSPRVFATSDPIPIPSIKSNSKLEKSTQKSLEEEDDKSPIYNDNNNFSISYEYEFDYDSIETSSSKSSSVDSYEIFRMSFENPNPNPNLQLEKKKKRKESKKLEKNKEKEDESISITPEDEESKNEAADLTLYLKEEEIEPDLEEYSTKRREQYKLKYAKNSSLNYNNNEDIENDSDFGSQSKKECYSLSF